MFDRKTLSIMTGRGGAPCICCKATRDEINTVANVVCGFSFECSIADVKETIHQLTFEGRELMSYKSDQRCGITHQPASDIDIVPVAPLHSYLRILDWFLSVIYSVIYSVDTWFATVSTK